MIYTVTFNPALDYLISLNEIKIGEINRSEKEEVFYGGKGINVSEVLTELGIPNKALGFIAGFTGAAIESGLKSMGVETDFITLKEGLSRINVKIRAGAETDFNVHGPNISGDEIRQLCSKIDFLTEGDFLVLAGSIPETLPEDIYETILKQLEGRGILYVVDATKNLLLNVLKYHPFLIKPNHIELGELFGTELKTEEDIAVHAYKLRKMGARNVLVSMAENGAVLVTETGDYHKISAPNGTVRNSVGAGDSMVAGFLAGYINTGDYCYALKLGTAAGSATAFRNGLAKKEDIFSLYNKL